MSQPLADITVTPTPPRLPRLKQRQEAALAAILTGATDVEAAATAGVARETVNRWKHSDPNFVAEMTRRRAQTWEASRDALRALLPKAVKTLADALDAPAAGTRLRAASLLLKTLGVAGDPLRPSLAPVSPDAVRDRWAEERRSREAFRRSQEELRVLEATFSPVIALPR